jgi:hypothetical protein
MIRTLIILLTLLLPLPSLAYQKGIALGLYAKEPTYSYERDLREIKAIGADHVSLVVSWYQRDIASTEIRPYWKRWGDFETLSDKKLVQVIRQAHKEGLKVFLFPILRLEMRIFKEWRGVIRPQNLERWLESYRRFTLHYARLAAREEVEIFSVGSELCSMEGYTEFWEKLIAEIRRFYPGKLLYSANWDHYKKIAFWDRLDYLGLNGYYELASDASPTLSEIRKKWWEIENELAAWQERHRKPIIFTELGYPSIDGGCFKPWDYTRDAPVDLEEQALCYEAFFLSWNQSRKLGGVYFWNWYGQGGENDRSYTPRGKPAERVLAKWFKNRSTDGILSFSNPQAAPPYFGKDPLPDPTPR